MKANDIVLAFGMIETQEAIDNLDEILSVKGLDAIYVGPSDLSISLGYNPGGDKPDEWMMAALKKMLDACKRHKVQPGLHCGAPAYAKKAIAMGFTFVTVGGDTRFLTMGAAAAVAEMRDAPKPGATARARTERTAAAPDAPLPGLDPGIAGAGWVRGSAARAPPASRHRARRPTGSRP